MRDWSDYLHPKLPPRFWSKVVQDGTCWSWVGSKCEGYGKFKISGDRVPKLAHRVSYEALVGPIPEGLELDHLCINRACVNPKHLEPVTTQVNLKRSTAWDINRNKTECPSGHPYSLDNTRLYRGGRYCRTCESWAFRKRKREQRESNLP